MAGPGLSCGIFLAVCKLLVVACIWDLVPRPGIEPGPPALGAQNLTHWATREVLVANILDYFTLTDSYYCSKKTKTKTLTTLIFNTEA